MSAVEALKAACAAGVRVRIDGDDLVLEASAPPSPAVLDLLSRHKAGIVTLLRSADGRAGIGEFDGGLPHAEAEARAFACCVAEWLNRNPAGSSPGRCLGCGNGDHAYDPLLPFGIESTGHAWLQAKHGGILPLDRREPAARGRLP
jgi:hypothetical protein